MTDIPSTLDQITTLEAKVDALSTKIDAVQSVASAPTDREAFAAALDRIKFYRDESSREWSLLTNRVNSYITSQSFLISSFAIAMGNTTHESTWFRPLFTLILVIVGIVTSLRAAPGINGAAVIIDHWRAKYNAMFEGLDEDDPLLEYHDKREMTAPARPGIIARVEHAARHRSHDLSEQSSPGKIDLIHETSLYFAKQSPRIFIRAWCCLGALSVVISAISLLTRFGAHR